jgi:CheY-like chemotaxis protein
MSPRYRVLVADEDDVETWVGYLSGLDCDTKLATSADVLDCVADWHPDLVVLDANMSAGSGFDICRQIKRHVGTPKTMVLMVTQLNELDEIERAVEAGTDDFLSKPVNKAEFLKRTENLLKLTRL